MSEELFSSFKVRETADSSVPMATATAEAGDGAAPPEAGATAPPPPTPPQKPTTPELDASGGRLDDDAEDPKTAALRARLDAVVETLEVAQDDLAERAREKAILEERVRELELQIENMGAQQQSATSSDGDGAWGRELLSRVAAAEAAAKAAKKETEAAIAQAAAADARALEAEQKAAAAAAEGGTKGSVDGDLKEELAAESKRRQALEASVQALTAALEKQRGVSKARKAEISELRVKLGQSSADQEAQRQRIMEEARGFVQKVSADAEAMRDEMDARAEALAAKLTKRKDELRSVRADLARAQQDLAEAEETIAKLKTQHSDKDAELDEGLSIVETQAEELTEAKRRIEELERENAGLADALEEAQADADDALEKLAATEYGEGKTVRQAVSEAREARAAAEAADEKLREARSRVAELEAERATLFERAEKATEVSMRSQARVKELEKAMTDARWKAMIASGARGEESVLRTAAAQSRIAVRMPMQPPSGGVAPLGVSGMRGRTSASGTGSAAVASLLEMSGALAAPGHATSTPSDTQSLASR